MRVNNTFRWIIDCFWRKYCRDSPRQTSFIVFQKCSCTVSFLACSLIDRWQIIVKIMFQSLFGSLLNHLYQYANIYVIYRLRVGPHFQDRGHSFSPYGPTLSRQITSLYIHCGSKLTFFVERGGRDHSPWTVAYSGSINLVILHSNNVGAVKVSKEPTVLCLL